MIWIAGCAPLITAQPAVSPIMPSETPSVATTTPISTPTVQVAWTPSLPPTPRMTVEEKCMTIEEQVPVDPEIPGIWLVGRTDPYLEDITTGKKIGIPLKGTNTLSRDRDGYAVSPNREWFAYIDQYIDGTAANKRILRIINSSGESLPLDFWSENFQWIIGWVDNEHIALQLNKTSVTRQKIVILNPFTGDSKDITPTWIKRFHDLDPYWIPQIYYSPDASRAVVIVNRNFELKDVQTDSTLFQGEHINTLPYLDWSSDSSKLAIVENGNKYLYIFDKNEEIVKLDYLDFDTIFRFGRVLWSPDGQKLLFASGDLYVFNVELGRITKICFNDKVTWGRYHEPLWSPHNQFIIIDASEYSDSAGWVDFDVMIDIKEMRTYQLPRKSIYYERLAWLATP